MTDPDPDGEPRAPAEPSAERPVEPLGDAPASDRVPPDHLTIDPASPHFDADRLRRGVAIRFKGRRRTDIEEYCISEGWVRVQAGRSLDRRGRPLTIRLNGPVEAWYEDLGEDAPVARKD